MAFYHILCKISGSITCLPFEDSTTPAETILVTVTAVTDAVEGEAASVAIFTVTDLPERPYFMEASYVEILVRNSIMRICLSKTTHVTKHAGNRPKRHRRTLRRRHGRRQRYLL